MHVRAGGGIHAGLDARAAAIVMRTVRNIVNTGRTIVCTIHQPSRPLFGAPVDWECGGVGGLPLCSLLVPGAWAYQG